MTVDQRSDSLTTAGDDVHGEEVQWYNLSDGLVNELGGTVAEDREKGVLSCFFLDEWKDFFSGAWHLRHQRQWHAAFRSRRRSARGECTLQTVSTRSQQDTQSL